VGQIAREDGSTFSSEQASDLLTCLHYFLSFTLGRWAGLALPIGFDAAGNRVFEEWGLRSSADGAWNSSLSWFDPLHGELIAQVFPGFLTLWKNDVWRIPIANAIYWYLGSCNHSVDIGVDTGIILAQTALELLAWNYCVVDRKVVSRKAFERGGLVAADKMRLLASVLGIPCALTPSIAAMQPKTGARWEDSMDAITRIRNALVHPDARTPFTTTDYYEAWRLSMWFIDLVLLRLCKHVGSYVNRLNTRFTGMVESVPWV
jgi:hypothetical protein